MGYKLFAFKFKLQKGYDRSNCGNCGLVGKTGCPMTEGLAAQILLPLLGQDTSAEIAPNGVGRSLSSECDGLE